MTEQNKVRIKRKKICSAHGLSDKAIAELNKISTLNYLRYVDGKISRMKPTQKLKLEEFGILKREPRKDGRPRRQVRATGIFVFTKKGLKYLEELNNE